MAYLPTIFGGGSTHSTRSGSISETGRGLTKDIEELTSVELIMNL